MASRPSDHKIIIALITSYLDDNGYAELARQLRHISLDQGFNPDELVWTYPDAPECIARMLREWRKSVSGLTSSEVSEDDGQSIVSTVETPSETSESGCSDGDEDGDDEEDQDDHEYPLNEMRADIIDGEAVEISNDGSDGEEEPIPMANDLKRKRESSSSSNTSSDSSASDDDMDDVAASVNRTDSDDTSSGKGSSDNDRRPTKRPKLISEPSSSDDSSSSSGLEGEEVDGGASVSSDRSSPGNSSDSDSDSVSSSSDSDSGSGSDSSSSASPPPKKTAKSSTIPLHEKRTIKKSAVKAQEEDSHLSATSAASSATLVGDASEKEASELDTLVIPPPTSNDNAGMHPSRANRMPKEKATAVPATKENIAKLKKEAVPFSRIPKDAVVDLKFRSNAYVPYDYAERAHRDLIVTKGKDFTKEKNKKKRGAYRGGVIDFTPKGIKFDD